ncbi:hypothetical protein AVEN_173976-1 [Araneus ventricosus]|uniref:G-protein coupled receptors family 2 profile 1 domain-containing protein n=1 Tax=Araneus ventricosus TaxID=182803 RepID=A0A4Y2JZU8_ARAVE|nr:hypothetical protein AVEN_173976-1 [Araneus ventricosus]
MDLKDDPEKKRCKPRTSHTDDNCSNVERLIMEDCRVKVREIVELTGIHGPYCPRTWDGWQCWDDTPGGTTAKDICQGHIYFDNEPPSCPSKNHFSS